MSDQPTSPPQTQPPSGPPPLFGPADMRVFRLLAAALGVNFSAMALISGGDLRFLLLALGLAVLTFAASLGALALWRWARQRAVQEKGRGDAGPGRE